MPHAARPAASWSRGGWLLGAGRRAAWRRRVLRRGVALICLALAAWLIAPARESRAPTAVAVVATRTVPAGRVVQTQDLSRVQRPAADLPAGVVTDPSEVAGGVATIAIRAGEVITPGRVADAGMLQGLPDGLLAVPVRVRDAAWLTIVRPGDRVDLHAQGGEAVATEALILAVLGDASVSDPGLLGGVAGPPPTLVVALGPDAARRVSAATDLGATSAGFGLAVHARDGLPHAIDAS